VSFSRRCGRLPLPWQRAWDDLAPTLVVDVPRGERETSVAPGARVHWPTVFGRDAPMALEIGSGSGDAVVAAAAAETACDFLAVEVYRPGVAQTLHQIGKLGLTNVRVVQADATDVLTELVPPGILTELWTYFPDPWPKNGHRHRRLVTPAAAGLIASRLVPSGRWRIATDWAPYARQMRDVGEACPLLTNPYAGAHSTSADPRGGWSPRSAARPVTRFERRGIAAGRLIAELEFVRR